MFLSAFVSITVGHKIKKKKNTKTLLWFMSKSVLSMASPARAWVPYLVGELTSCKPHGAVINK